MARVRELEVRERIAMIEKGLIPSPESNPRGFEQAMSAMARSADRDWYEDPQLRAFVLQRHYRRAERQRGAGITLIGIGFGLMLMLAYAAGSPSRDSASAGSSSCSVLPFSSTASSTGATGLGKTRSPASRPPPSRRHLPPVPIRISHPDPD
jgi:hypothetical protein